MYILQPIERLQIDKAIKLGNAYLIPFFTNPTEITFSGDFTEGECINIFEMVGVLQATTSLKSLRTPYLIYEFNHDIKIVNGTPKEHFDFTEKISLNSNRYFDPIRVELCDMNDTHSLPGRPGVYNNYLYSFVYDFDQGKGWEMLGDIISYYSKGLGMYLDVEFFDDFAWYLDSRTDIISKVCKVSYNRLNEAMYFENIESKLIYITSTFESLASSTYMRFQDMKKILVPFTSDSRTDYQNKIAWFKELSEVRKEVVHNGKRLIDFMEKDKIEELFDLLQTYLVEIIRNIYKSDVRDFEQLKMKKIEIYNRLP